MLCLVKRTKQNPKIITLSPLKLVILSEAKDLLSFMPAPMLAQETSVLAIKQQVLRLRLRMTKWVSA
jgi:hypothetical protein